MKLRTVRAIFSVTSALVLTLTAAQVWASARQVAQEAQDGQRQEWWRRRPPQSRQVEGVWDVRVTRRDCQTGGPAATPPNRVRNMFIRGGTLLETPSGNPTTRGPGLGTWQYLGGRSYRAVFRFFRFNPDGSLAGTRKVTRTVELSEDANEFAATASDELFDADDNLIQTGCATETATRLE